MTQTIKVLTLIDYNPITGAKYGEKEIRLNELELMYKSEQLKQKNRKSKIQYTPKTTVKKCFLNYFVK